MHEIVEVIVLNFLFDSALTLYADCQIEEGQFMNEALRPAPPIVLITLRWWWTLLWVDEASVDEFKEAWEEFGRITLHVQVENAIEVEELVEFNSNSVDAQISL